MTEVSCLGGYGDGGIKKGVGPPDRGGSLKDKEFKGDEEKG